VLDYNNRIDVFPTLMVARLFNFTPAEFFEADEEGKAEVRITFGSERAASHPPSPSAPTS
jgi:hypothetical protein